jgi:hypothetical protein
VRTKLQYQLTPLLMAVDRGRTQVARALLMRGAGMRKRSAYHESVFDIANVAGRLDMVSMLVGMRASRSVLVLCAAGEVRRVSKRAVVRKLPKALVFVLRSFLS